MLNVATLLLLCYVLLLLHQLQAQTVESICGSKDLCVTEKLCSDSDDTGRGAIEPRIAKYCGNGYICCDREQLEIWNSTFRKSPRTRTFQRHSDSTILSTPTTASHTSTTSTTITEEPSGYESCGVNMECVPRKLCQDNLINDDGRFLLNPRIGETPCPRALHRCCAIDMQLPANKSSYDSKLGSFVYKGCGWSNEQGLIKDQDNYEYAKDVSLFAEFPWMVALITGRNQYVCGGTLIHPQLVLTSAHNIRNHTVDTLVARTGEWDLNSLDEPHEHQARRIKQIITHEDFDPEVYFNDIALLVLDEPVEIQPHIQPLCLPPPESLTVQADLREAQCFATGWGGRKPNSDHNERLLKRIDLPIVSSVECQAQLRVTRLGRRFRLRPSFLCAGGIEGKDTCKGDGGSPLFCTLPEETTRYQLAGIVSWGIQCAKEDIPAVYTNVPYLRSWIDEKVKSLGFKIDGP